MTMLRFCARRILLAAPVIALLSTGACERAQIFLTRVTASVKVVKVSPATAHIRLGGQAQLSALTETSENTPLPGRVVIWSSSNASVATVNEIGRAHAELQSPCNIVCRLLLEKKKLAPRSSNRASRRDRE